MRFIAKKFTFLLHLSRVPPRKSYLSGSNQLWALESLVSQPNPNRWERKSSSLIPVTTDKPLASDNLLKMVFWSCKGNKHENLNLKACKCCSCKKAGLYCTLACWLCNGQYYLNDDTSTSTAENLENEEDNEDADFY